MRANNPSVDRLKSRFTNVLNIIQFTSTLYLPLTAYALRGLNTLGWFLAIVFKGDKCYDFLFAFLWTKPLLKKDLIEKERICSQTPKGRKFSPFKAELLVRRRSSPVWQSCRPESAFIPLNIYHSLGKFSRRQIDDICFSPHSHPFDISCKLSPIKTICMKCQNLFLG